MSKESFPKVESYAEKINSKQSEPESNITRRDFLKKFGVAVGSVGLGISQIADISTYHVLEQWELEQSEKNWEAWQAEILKHLKNSMYYLENVDIQAIAEVKAKKYEYLSNDQEREIEAWKSEIKRSVKESGAQYDNILKLILEVESSRMYKGYLKAFNEWINLPERENLDLADKYEEARYLIGNVEQFINNIIYSKKIEKEYNVSVTGENTKFFMSDIKSVYEAFESLPHFAIKKSGFKRLTLAESMPGSSAQMGESEMLGEFKKYDPNARVAYHELAHAFDGNIEKGTDFPGWIKINHGASPYVYSSGAEAIATDLKNPTNPYAQIQNVPGYARAYGWKGGIAEDKATVSESLFDENNLRELISRSMRDPILRRKVEFMTGYRLDNPYVIKKNINKTDKETIEEYFKQEKTIKNYVERHVKDEKRKKFHLDILESIDPRLYRFGTPLTEKDYQNAGFPGFCYWPIWSRDDMGKTWMDAKYFNAILEGKKVVFKEENGQTFREILFKDPTKN